MRSALRGGPARVLIGAASAAGLLLAPSPLAGAGEPAGSRLWLTYGDYMTGFQCLPDMARLLVAAADPEAPPIARLALGIGAHGSTADIWKSGAHAWIAGQGKVSTTNWRDNSGMQKAATAFEGRKADLVMVQLDLGYAAGGRDADELRAETEEAVAGYVAAAQKAGARLVFYVLPGSQHSTHKRGGKARDAPLAPKTEADHQPQLQALETECRRLADRHGAVMAPTFRAFAALRKAHPEMDLHAPTRGDDTHLSPRDAALAALVIARAFLGPSFAPPTAAGILLAPQNQRIAADNARRKAKGEPEQPLNAIDAAVWKAMLEAVTATFAAPKGL